MSVDANRTSVDRLRICGLFGLKKKKGYVRAQTAYCISHAASELNPGTLSMTSSWPHIVFGRASISYPGSKLIKYIAIAIYGLLRNEGQALLRPRAIPMRVFKSGPGIDGNALGSLINWQPYWRRNHANGKLYAAP